MVINEVVFIQYYYLIDDMRRVTLYIVLYIITVIIIKIL